MRSSFIIIAAFVVGVAAAWCELLPTWLTDGSVAMWVLYALMLQVGIGIGSDPRLKEILRSLSPRLLILPFCKRGRLRQRWCGRYNGAGFSDDAGMSRYHVAGFAA